MREIMKSQMQFGEVDISQIQFDIRCRDEIPKLLIGLQHIYCTPELKEEVFSILEELIPSQVSTGKGRRGMELWKILVLGTIRLNCNWDFDKLHDIANNHNTLRQMLGHGIRDCEHYYALQTLKDNVALLTPEILDRINQVVVKAGHKVLLKKNDEELRGRCDSFVEKTDVHYPTDISLLYDAIRKVLSLLGSLCDDHGLTDFRQWKYNVRVIKKSYNRAQKIKSSTSRNVVKQIRRAHKIKEVHTCYLTRVRTFLCKSEKVLAQFIHPSLRTYFLLQQISHYKKYAYILIDQIERRVLRGEKIPHEEKLFSVFEPHTEWIVKGKAGVPQELGIRVSVVEDQFGFILHHMVMQQQTDEKGAVPLIVETKERFPSMVSCSFDKGFYTPDNRKALSTILTTVAMSKKGRRTNREKEYESSEEFIRAKQGHPAIESCIHALMNHGLDRCLSHGMSGLQKHVALAIVGRNIQKLGHVLQQKELKRQQRLEKLRDTWYTKKFTIAA